MKELKNKTSQNKIEQLTLGDQPEKIKCPYCAAQTNTQIQFRNGFLTYTLSLLVLVTIPLLASIFLIPIVILLTKNLCHICLCCDNKVGSNGNLIYALNIKDGIVSFKIGEIGFILTRKIILNIIILIITFLVIMYKIKNTTYHSHKYGHSHANDLLYYTNSTWNVFISECSIQKFREKGQQQMSYCWNNHIDRTIVSWEGHVIRVEDL
ncbi:hypothetical protein IMG5_170610 [Ichthyophthirius multifiliis]|uniref:LITAF domain-containing protein n=1 Tax=Ichthyophthirius multifiliis TaxID=5932 RepID=G0R1H6_ICHMU|nr:hypothetical protein IMG5_170610 [Ichthyophthirius multifiliis]EGR28677.1 hypothetical protein IMG5_170610 [Ichthyophthirius multifiliis]|eukprot:XP_004029913.1 hypothetical protein IMG5_170610 [Ichthyophthirius multifiliis]